ncbi:MAG: polymer-forming cytoskeletal protein [Anaerolineae bacterium]|nr:MAG: polymer-forming cytoskeletal protein [Anaerolineae bacterium]
MKTIRKLLWTSLLVFTLFISTAAPALAAGPLDGRVVFGDSFTLEAGQVLDGDLVIFGGSVSLEEGSRVEGDVAVLGGSADVAGAVDGDLVVFGGSADLESTAVVEGELVAFGGKIDRAEGAVVRGNVVEGLTFGENFRFPTFAKAWSNDYRYRWDNWVLRFLFRAFRALAAAVLLTVIGALVAIFIPQPLERVSQAVLVAPLHSWLVGFVSAVLAVLVGAVLIATLCLSPFGAVIWLALLVAGVLGWIALSLIVGLKVLERLNASDVTPVKGAIVGGAILSLLTAALWIFTDCCLGWPFFILIGSFGLGAVVLTRFGRQEYVPASTVAVPQLPMAVEEKEGEWETAEPETPEEPEETAQGSADDFEEKAADG